MENLPGQNLPPEDSFWDREPERRQSRRSLLWLLIGLLFALLGAITDLPKRFTFQ